MITKWATDIASKLTKISGEDICQDQLNIYIYGLECFFNTFITIILLTLWGILSHTLGFTWFWVMTFNLLRHFTGGAHAPTQFTCILGSFILGCLDKWAIIYMKQTPWGYILLMLMCILFAPASNNKISLSSRQKKIHKLISVIIVSVGFLLFCKIGDTELTATVFYSFWCVIILMILEHIKFPNQTVKIMSDSI